MTSHYNTLGVEKSATQHEIKSAYRKLVMQHHPDKGGDVDKFQEISEAYVTLSDTDKRSQYDNPTQHTGRFNNGPPPGFEDIFSPESPFGNIFGFRNRAPTNSHIQFSTTITLEEVFTGKEIVAGIILPSGREQAINIKIPVGIHTGDTLKLSGMGDDSITSAPRGDILLNVQVEDHPNFHRSGDDLIKEVEINCIDAMLGKKLDVVSIDNRNLQMDIPAGTQNDAVFNLSGFGMPNFNSPDRRGRLLLKIKINVPILTDEQKDILRTLNTCT